MSPTPLSTMSLLSAKPARPSTRLPLARMLCIAHHMASRIPGWLLRKMLMNNAVSAAVGFIPIAGDVVLAAFKANSRNAALLEEFLRIRGEEFLKREQDRVQDPATVKPGAGQQPGEHVPGKDEVKKSGSWFRRRSKGKEVAATGVTEPSRRESRFVENVTEGRNSNAKR